MRISVWMRRNEYDDGIGIVWKISENVIEIGIASGNEIEIVNVSGVDYVFDIDRRKGIEIWIVFGDRGGIGDDDDDDYYYEAEVVQESEAEGRSCPE